MSAGTAGRLIAVVLDENSIGRNTPDIEQERQVAIIDLLENNTFALPNGPPGPYRLLLALIENRLVFRVSCETGEEVAAHLLALSTFRRLMKDYFLVCESYYTAIRNAPAGRIEAIDMSRRALHDEGSRILIERLDGKITLDFDTARRLFTLVCALHWKG